MRKSLVRDSFTFPFLITSADHTTTRIFIHYPPNLMCSLLGPPNLQTAFPKRLPRGYSDRGTGTLYLGRILELIATSARTHTKRSTCSRATRADVLTHTRVCVHMHDHIHTHTHAYTHTCTYTYTYKYKYTYTYTYT